MNLFKKTTATIALVTLMSGIFSTGVSAAYSTAQVEAANALADAGIINDHSDDAAAYNLDQNVLRQEIAAVARGVAGLDKKDTCDNVFSDVSATTPNTWACYSVEALADADLIALNDTFRPEDNISKAEAVGMMVKAAFGDDYSFDSSKGTSWQEQVVDFAVDNGVVASFTNYDTAATRGFVFEAGANAISSTEEDDSDDILSNLLGGLDDLDEDEEEETTTVVVEDEEEEEEETTTTVVYGDNELVVELSPESPDDGYVAADRERTEILAFDVTAGSEDVTLEEATLEYIGLSDSDDFDVIEMYLDNEKVTKGDSKGFSDGEVDLAFENDTVIMAGETKTIYVTAKIEEADGTVYHKVALTNLEASSDVEGDYVKSVSFTVVDSSNVGVLELDIDEEGGDVIIGDTETFATFTLEEADDTEDIEVRSITIEFEGVDAEDDISDLVLYAEDEEIVSDIEINSDDEAIVSVYYVVEADEKVEFTLEGVVTGGIGDTVTAYLTDIYAVGEETGLVAEIDFDDEDYDTVELSDAREIIGSEINVSFDKSDVDEAMPNAEGVLVGTLELSSVSDYTIDEIEVVVTTTNTGVLNLIDDLELDGASYDSENGADEDDMSVTFTFEDIDLKADQDEELDLTFDIVDNTELNGEEVTFDISIVEVTDEENDETYTDGGSNDLADILSTNSLDDKSIDIESASFTLTQTTVSEEEVVIGDNVEVLLYKGKLSVGDSDAVTLDDIAFTATLSNSDYDLEDIVDSAELNIDGETFDADVESDSLDFTSMNAEIEAGADNLVVTLTAVLTDSDDVDQGDTLVVDTIDTDELTLEDSEGEDLLDGNIEINTTTEDTTIVLNENGDLTFAVVNNGENEDEIEDVVLAGTSSVALAEVELEAEEEDIKVKELVFKVKGSTDGTSEYDIETTTSYSGGTAEVQTLTVNTISGVAAALSVTFDGETEYFDLAADDTTDEIATAIATAFDSDVSGSTVTLTGSTVADIADATFVVDGGFATATVVEATPAVTTTTVETIEIDFGKTYETGDTLVVDVNGTDYVTASGSTDYSDIAQAIEDAEPTTVASANASGDTITIVSVAGETNTVDTTGTDNVDGTDVVDFSDTLNDVRLVNGSSIIADGAIVTFDGTNTLITFEDDFTIEESADEIQALLVADIETYTTEGGETSAVLGNVQVAYYDSELKGVNSNDDIEVELANNNETSDAVSIAPALVTVSIDDELGEDDDDAVISFATDLGDNSFDNEDIHIYSITLESDVAGTTDVLNIRNDDSDLLDDGSDSTVDGEQVYVLSDEVVSSGNTVGNIDDIKINDGDEYELTVADEDDELVITAIQFWIDLDDDSKITSDELFDITNEDNIDLDKYTK